MGTKQQSGMEGVFLVAAELAKRNYIVSPTSRNAKGADLLITDQDCSKAWTIQVKTNKKVFNFFLLGKHSKGMKADSHFYVFVNLKKTGTEYFIVPAKIVSERMVSGKSPTGNIWSQINRDKIMEYKDNWNVLGD
jgi:hypothetical protein